MMRSGGTPNLASTPASSSTSSLMVLTQRTPGRTSWVRSLSPVEMTTSQPRSCASRVKVPMTSSASTPSTDSSGQPSACTASCSGAICARRSSGIGGRCDLYSGYQSSRKVLPLASKTQARNSAL